VEIANPGRRVNLTADFSPIAQMPSVSPDGRHLVFDSCGTVCVARIAGQDMQDVRRVLESQ
jgi:Tol biopolymer transport system component